LPPVRPACKATQMLLLRHGQSEFNLHMAATRRDPGIIDPRLTEYGHAQAREAARHLADSGIRRIVTSPYTRALQTVEPIARALDVPVTIHPIVRERYAFACDVEPHATNWHAPGRSMTSPGSMISGGPRWRNQRIRSSLARPVPRRTGRTAGLVRDAGRQPLGFILCMTGQSVANCQWMRCDPTAEAPDQLVWRV